MGGSSRTRLLFIMFQLVYLVASQEVVKRVPQGFVGMRGKKLISDTDSAELEHFFKRKPQFFVGVKGKKSTLDGLELDTSYKRAPMGFVGMRGKKTSLSEDVYYPESFNKYPRMSGSLIGQIDYATNEDGRNFGPKILNEIITEYLEKLRNVNSVNAFMPEIDEELSEERITNEIEKRAANIHQFFGVRGKKSMQNKRPYDLTFRGKFIGVRGKKDIKNDNIQELRFLLGNQPWSKRKTQMGFFGMRGKKWTDDRLTGTQTSASTPTDE